MSARPVVSVIMAAFNAAETIDVQLEALAQQSGTAARPLPAWELIVADNGSTDSTLARVHSWAKYFENLVVVDASACRGPAAARNIGAASARGALLLFCDADDAADPHWIAQLTHALEAADAASGSRAYDALNTKRSGPADWPSPIFAKQPLTQLAAASSHNLAVRRPVFETVGGFAERLSTAEDVDLCWRLQLAGFSFAAAPGALMQIRRRTGLTAVFRQACAYGRGDRMLAQRFAGVNAHHGHEPIPVVGEPAPASAANNLKAPEEGVRRRRLLPDLEFRAHRLGHLLGSRFGRDPVPPLSMETSR